MSGRPVIALVVAAFFSSSGVASTIPHLENVDPLRLPPTATRKPVLAVTNAEQPEAKIVPRLWERIARSADGKRVPLIIELAEPFLEASAAPRSVEWDAQKAEAIAVLAREFAPRAEALGLANVRALSHVPMIFGEIESSRVIELARLPEVLRIYENEVLQPHRLEGASLMRATTLKNAIGSRVALIGVAVIDSGVSVHPELVGRISAQYDWTGTTNDGTIDTAGHGTAVAGIIAGSNGIAPYAHIWALKVCTDSGCPTDAILGALNQAYAFRNDPRYGGLHIINMSLGGGGPYNTDCDGISPFNAILNSLFAAGLTVFVSAGNEGYVGGVSHPACHSKVISVGAVYDANIGPVSFAPPANCTNSTTGADQPACYSNWGAPLDVMAPSHCALTTAPFGGYTPCFGGTSAAAPYAAGVAALILSALPGTSPTAIQNALMSTGKPIAGPGGMTRNRIDAYSAFQRLTGVNVCTRDADTACLQNNRFEVKVKWQNSGSNGAAHVLSFGGQRAENNESALFHFQTSTNFEMGVKVLDACIPALGNKYWVFASGLTDQGWSLTVRDMTTNTVRTYSNTNGHLSATFGDTAAFSCP